MPAETDGAAPDLETLSDRWRREAERYEADGALADASKLLTRVAEELEEALHVYAVEWIPIRQAKEETEYSAERLRELAAGDPENVGPNEIPCRRENGKIYLRRCDLPVKPNKGDSDVARELASRILHAREIA